MKMYKSIRKFLSPLRRKFNEIIFFINYYYRKSNYGPKVFCIGYNKTGTTSMGHAFEKLGYFNSSFNKRVWRKYYANSQYDKILKYTSKFDSFDDLPWLKEDMIPILDKTFPGSKFVYLTREEEAWKKSIYKWTFKMTGKYIDVDKAYKEFKEHQNFVFDYFKNRPKEDFIIIDISDKNGFNKLASFLGKARPNCEFPKVNIT